MINVTRYKRHNFLDNPRVGINFKYHLISAGGNLKVNGKIDPKNILRKLTFYFIKDFKKISTVKNLNINTLFENLFLFFSILH